MDKHTRLQTAFNLKLPDRPPILGGWLAAPQHICVLAGCSPDEYWADTFYWSLQAERALGSDGVIDIFEPISRGAYRIVNNQVLEERAAYTIESVLAEIDELPDPDTLEASFDEEEAYADYVEELTGIQLLCGDLLWCPADWRIIPKALWYDRFGYENALTTLALHPDRYRKLIQVSAVKGRQRARLIVRAISAGIHPIAILTGEDLCSQNGSIVSPDFLRQEYFPLVQYTLEPLLDVNAKIVWHCDGDYGQLLDDVLNCGVAGLQGFQKECNMDLEWIVDLKTRSGDPLLIFGAMSVTTTLPYGTPREVKAEVKQTMELCRDKAALVFFTSNTITPDVPLENIRAYWDAVCENSW
jgi:uroporphyrinogen decarboxylase